MHPTHKYTSSSPSVLIPVQNLLVCKSKSWIALFFQKQQSRHKRSKENHINRKESIPRPLYSLLNSGTDSSIESGSHLNHQPKRKKRFTKKKSERKKTSSSLEPHGKRKVNPTEIKIPDVVEGKDDNEPKDETQVALNSFSRKRTDHEFEEFDSKKIKMEPDRYETDLTYEVRTVDKIEYMSDDSGAVNMSDVSEVHRFPGMITVFEMYCLVAFDTLTAYCM